MWLVAGVSCARRACLVVSSVTRPRPCRRRTGLFHVAGNVVHRVVVHRVVGERVVVRARTSRQLLDLREREVVPLAAAARGVEVDEARVVLAVLVGRLVLRFVRHRWLSEDQSPAVAAPGGLWVGVRGGVAPAAAAVVHHLA